MSSAKPPRRPKRGPGDEAAALRAFFLGLAARAAEDGAFAAQLMAILRESGLLAVAAEPTGEAGDAAPRRSSRRPAAARPAEATDLLPDPFALLRERGEAGLRDALVSLDLPTLRAIVRARRLDPARISARWSARERVVTLIVEQVRARANHGRAFERV